MCSLNSDNTCGDGMFIVQTKFKATYRVNSDMDELDLTDAEKKATD